MLHTATLRAYACIVKRSDGRTLKDTLVNIQEAGECVHNLVTLPQFEAIRLGSKTRYTGIFTARAR